MEEQKRPDWQNCLVFEKWEVAYILGQSERTLDEMISTGLCPHGLKTSANSRPRWHKETIAAVAAKLYSQKVA